MKHFLKFFNFLIKAFLIIVSFYALIFIIFFVLKDMEETDRMFCFKSIDEKREIIIGLEENDLIATTYSVYKIDFIGKDSVKLLKSINRLSGMEDPKQRIRKLRFPDSSFVQKIVVSKEKFLNLEIEYQNDIDNYLKN